MILHCHIVMVGSGGRGRSGLRKATSVFFRSAHVGSWSKKLVLVIASSM